MRESGYSFHMCTRTLAASLVACTLGLLPRTLSAQNTQPQSPSVSADSSAVSILFLRRQAQDAQRRAGQPISWGLVIETGHSDFTYGSKRLALSTVTRLPSRLKTAIFTNKR